MLGTFCAMNEERAYWLLYLVVVFHVIVIVIFIVVNRLGGIVLCGYRHSRANK